MKNMSIKKLLGLLTCSAALVLTGCGGGGGATVAASTTDTPTVPVANTYTIGGTVSGTATTLQASLTQIVGGVSTKSALGLLPNGVFSLPTAVTPGTRFMITVTEPTGEVCSVVNGVGLIAASNVTNVKVTCTQGAVHSVYVPNLNSSDISQFSIGSGGVLSPLTTPLVSSPSPVALTLDSTGQFAYAADSAGDLISQFSVAADGSLNPLTPAAVSGPLGIGNIVIHPSGKWAYSGGTNAPGPLNQYDRDVTTGLLTPMTTNPSFNTVSSVDGMAIDPTGKFAYVLHSVDKTIDQFSVNQTTGQLSFLAVKTLSEQPWAMAFDPSGQFAYVTSFIFTTGSSVTPYNIQADGSLLAITTNPIAFVASAVPTNIVVDPFGKYVYVGIANLDANFTFSNANSIIVQYTIQSDGSLVLGNAQKFVGSTSGVTLDSSGQYAYAVNGQSNTVYHYAINQTNGNLSPVNVYAPVLPGGNNVNFLFTGGNYAYGIAGR